MTVTFTITEAATNCEATTRTDVGSADETSVYDLEPGTHRINVRHSQAATTAWLACTID